MSEAINRGSPLERSGRAMERRSVSRGPAEAPLLSSDGMVAVAADIRRSHNTQKDKELDDVHRIADLLEERLIERTRDLERATKERQEAQSILHELQKLETMGHLTGGIAHDFNNMLSVISGNVGLLERRLRPGDTDLKRLAANAIKAVERAGALTQQLLAFARRQPLQAKLVDVNALVLEMKDLLGHTLGETVVIESTLGEELWSAFVDKNQLENALINLAVNARDAMPDGGRLSMETANAVIGDDYAAMHAEVHAGDYVTIAVIDTGMGMTPEVAAMAFEPFFTTKHVGEGSGLGLSQVYGFLKQSGGHVTMISKVGVGTAVTLYLPRLTATLDGDLPAGDQAEPAQAGPTRETILVVEDDESVRSSISGILRDLGYRVLSASDGPSALRTLEREPGIDLLFADIGLPGALPGHVLAETASAQKPDLKILLTSGYVSAGVAHPGAWAQRVELLAKPSTYAKLAATVRHVLDRAAVGAMAGKQ
jgi:signal transduction histidine kinase/ActR/RegA family two-component response regulator